MLGKQLKAHHIPVKHIDNPMTMTRFEDNGAYMEKTERNLQTLYRFGKELEGYSGLLGKGRVVATLMRLWHRLFGSCERKQLCGSHPRLWMYNMYRLGYYLTMKD